MELTKDTIIFEILQTHPSSIRVFEKLGMNCSSCMGVMKESLEVAAKKHGIDINILINELKTTIK